MRKSNEQMYLSPKCLTKKLNTLIFPDFKFFGNIAYKLLAELGNAEAIGPFLLGMK